MQECEDILYKVGARVLMIGASGSGKTEFLLRLLDKSNRQDYFEVAPSRILFCSHMKSSEITSGAAGVDSGVEFIAAIPDDDHVFDPYTLLIFDDMLTGSEFESNAEKLVSYFCRRCHHEKLYCFVTAQNLFSPNKHFKTISRNANCLVLFKTYRNLQQIKILAQQLLGSGPLVTEMYKRATQASKYGYLLLDFHPQTDESLRFKTNVFGDDNDEPCVVYKVDN
jgi:hypothetical protein